MTREKALMLALKIIDICKRYGAEDRCRQCPFNARGCMVTDGNNVPTDWRASSLITMIEVRDNADK